MGNICDIHNEPNTTICECVSIYCDKCGHSCKCNSSCSIEDWKKQTLIEMQKFEDKLHNKIKGLNCICEIIGDDKSVIKQIEDIIDTIYVDISHINNFNQLINDNDNNIPISNIIKRKKVLLTKNVVVSILGRQSEIINIIIENDGDIHAQNERALRLASSSGNLDIVKCLIKYGADIHACNDEALRKACVSGHLSVVECLIKYGGNIHARDGYALRWASYCDHLAVVECLISNGANVRTNNNHALQLASYKGHLAVVKFLIKNGANIHSNNNLALRWASEYGHTHVVEYLTKTMNNN